MSIRKFRAPKVLDVVGYHSEVTICGDIELLQCLPIKHQQHLNLIDEYLRLPGNYEGRYSKSFKQHAKLIDYGNGYVALKLYDDISRLELGEYLLNMDWKVIGFATHKEDDKCYIIEKWTNVRD